MNYSEQQQFFKRSKMWTAAFVVLLIAAARAFAYLAGTVTRSSWIVLALAVLATSISLGYTPNYLHLTVNPLKTPRWQIKIRWRLAVLVLVIGLLLVSRGIGDIVVVAAAVWIVGTNLLVKKIAPTRHLSWYFWTADFILLGALFLAIQVDIVVGAALLVAETHLSVVAGDQDPFIWGGTVAGSSLVVLAFLRQGLALRSFFSASALVVVTVLMTTWLVLRAKKHNQVNSEQALRELIDFTGYTAEHIGQLWSTSNQQLAKNWKLAALDQNDREQLAQWYRENSELYMFAISAYNLEYKRIISNLRMMRFGCGSCLDYGAGNGELILELARRGHRATYYDVEGETLRFARLRAKQRNLSIEFLHTKDDLASSAQQHGFDTIFSFDVLEHLPDLPGELVFLSSLLNPGGLFVFDVPAGATKSHPMHLNHNLDVLTHMRAQGLTEERPGWIPKLPFTKQEKYLFRAPATATKQIRNLKLPITNSF